MTHITSDGSQIGEMGRLTSQPIALAGGVLLALVLGVGLIGVWRAYTGFSPEQDRLAASRQLQLRAAQVSEQIAEKTNGLELTQQASIDQLQVVQEQLQTVKRLVAAQKG